MNSRVPSDPIEQLIQQWGRERPDLDAFAMGVVGRVLRLSFRLEGRLERVLVEFGLTMWQFDVLATLRRNGEPFSLSPTDLMREVLLSSGAMTNRIDRLELKGLVRREPDPADRRGVQIVLTRKGRQLVDRAIAARFEDAREIVGLVTPGERAALEAGLGKILVAVEARAGSNGRESD